MRQPSTRGTPMHHSLAASSPSQFSSLVCSFSRTSGSCQSRNRLHYVSGRIMCGACRRCPCYVTTASRGFCGANLGFQSVNCDCTSNQECEQRVGKGARCFQAPVAGGVDLCGCSGSTNGCMAPCENLKPVA